MLSSILVLSFVTVQTCPCAYAFSLPFKKKKTEKIEQTKETSAVQIKAEKNEIVEYSLEDCIDIALKNDPNIKIYTTQKGIAHSQLGIAKSGYFPNITASTGFTSQQNRNSGSGGGFYNQGGSTSRSNNYYQLNLGVNQLIWDFGKTVAKINMQKYNKESVGYDLENTILNTVYNVKLAYYKALAALANQDVYERSVRINQLNYDRTNALFKEGLKSKIDVVNAQVYLTDAEVSLIDAQGKYDAAIINLNNAMYLTDAPSYNIKNTESFNFKRTQTSKDTVNISYVPKKSGSKEYEQTAVLTSGIEKQDILQDYKFKPLILPVNDAIQKAYENRPDLKSLLMVEKVQQESLKVIRRQYMPVVSLSAGYNYRRNSEVANTGLNIGVTADLPTLNIMGVKYNVDQGHQYLELARENINLSKKNIYFEIQNNYINMVVLQRKIPKNGRKGRTNTGKL